MFTTFAFSLLFAASTSAAAPATATMPSRVKLASQSDVALWHKALLGRADDDSGKHTVFVRASADDALSKLDELGLNAEAGKWEVARLDAASLRMALRTEGVELRASPAHQPLLQRSIPEIGGDLVRQGLGVQHSRTGRGVIVGIIDTGIDLGHPAFRRQDGTSRVIAAWDQDVAVGNPPEGYGYGHACTRAELKDDACEIGDSAGHGTHVAGIATGSGAPSGVAPEADIALVRSDTFTRLADAVLYLVEIADELKRPLVINVSVGGQYGPHDGRTPLEQYIGSLAGPGRLLVAAAGNDGAEKVHVGADLSETPARVGVRAVPIGAPSDTIVEFWSSPTIKAELTLELWENNRLVASMPLVTSEKEFARGRLTVNNRALADVVYSQETLPDHGMVKRTLLIDRESAAPLSATGVFAIRMEGKGRIDAWISQSDYRYGRARFSEALQDGWIAGDGSMSITVPASSPQVIAVGSYSVRTQWNSEKGGTQSAGRAVYGELSPFSSAGPTLAPKFTGGKPDISAPGSVIASARAFGIPTGPNTVSSDLMVMQGTSMSAPHVTGVVALMLEADPTLTPQRAAQILRMSARQDEFTGETPNANWGFGKLDAHAAVALTERLSGDESQRNSCGAVPPSSFLGLIVVIGALTRLQRRRSNPK